MYSDFNIDDFKTKIEKYNFDLIVVIFLFKKINDTALIYFDFIFNDLKKQFKQYSIIKLL